MRFFKCEIKEAGAVLTTWSFHEVFIKEKPDCKKE